MSLTLHEELEKQGPRIAPDAETAEELEGRQARRSTLELLGIIGLAAGTFIAIDESGVVRLPVALLLGALAVLTLATIADWIRTKGEDDDD